MAQSDQQIIEQILLGETQMYAVIVSKYQKKLFNFMLRLCLVKQDAEDLTQEAFIKAFAKINTYNGEASFGAWLKRIVINQCLDFIKKQSLKTVEIKEDIMVIGDDEDWNIDTETNIQDIYNCIEFKSVLR